MCGIVGFADSAGRASIGLADALDCLGHRGPDGTGIWSDTGSGIHLGHRRLAVIDPSHAGEQPMHSIDARFVLTFNGEIYNFPDLRRELEARRGAPWNGHSDTEVMLEGFVQWGVEETLRRCNGMFALAVWDRIERCLVLARDRMGEKPLYFGWMDGGFAFASSIPALEAMPAWSPRMAPAAIRTFLETGYVRGPCSAFEGVYRLPPGTLLAIGESDLQARHDWAWASDRISRYWSLDAAARAGMASPLVDGPETLLALADLLGDAVGKRMIADVPLGAFLSGGIDSSLVVALMQSRASRPIRTFSIGFSEPSHDEAPFARAVARHLATDHTEFYVRPEDALELVPGLAEAFDEPFSDQSQLPTMLVSRLARGSVTVALSGDGGDELFAGYSRYFSALQLLGALGKFSASHRDTPMAMLRLAANVLGRVPGTGGVELKVNRLAERLGNGDVDAMGLAFIGATGSPGSLTGQSPRCSDGERPPAWIAEPLRRLMYADQSGYLVDDILHKVDRSSMAYSLETRVPLLDHRIVEFSWRLPMSMLASKGMGKLALREVLYRFVPRELVSRPKQGFAPPIGDWIRGPLRDWAGSLLDDSLKDLPIHEPSAIRAAWSAHLSGRRDAGQLLWRVLMLAAWRKRFAASA